MRQAIEESFILDVLKHYTTYATYFGLLKACEDDPNVERKKAALALARFMRLPPHNIAQKTEVMVEHFQAVTRHKIGGRAKAMVVTGSRLEAVPLQAELRSVHPGKGLRHQVVGGLFGYSGGRQAGRRHLHRTGYEPRHLRERATGEVRDARVPGSARRGEVPDWVRSTASAHDVCGTSGLRASRPCKRCLG